MMTDTSRRIVITGLGPITGLGVGITPNWQAMLAGQHAIAPITSFNPAGFECQVGAEVKDFKVNQVVPKHYRKAVKVMARDIELAVGAADVAVRDAKLTTSGTAESPDAPKTYAPPRMGVHIGAGLIAAELNELTEAFVQSKDSQGRFDLHPWGSHAMTGITPLWMLKYLPNMLACHVSIIHDAQGPSNTITCAEASSGLSIGESMRVLQRHAADVCLSGGTESKLNLMAYIRQAFAKHLAPALPQDANHAMKAMSQQSNGTILGEGGAILVLEALEAYQKRSDQPAYAELVGFGASQSIHPESRNRLPDPQGRGTAQAIAQALNSAGITPQHISAIFPCGSGIAAHDQAERNGLATIFGTSLPKIPLGLIKPMTGHCGAGAGSLDVCIAAQAIATQTLPARINNDHPLEGLNSATCASQPTKLDYVLVCSQSLGGQNTAIVLKQFQP